MRALQKRKNIVFGSGNEKAEIVFVGEAPGEDEDIKGETLCRQGRPAFDKDY